MTLLWFILACLTAVTTPCSAEDDPGPCYWNVSTMGDGQGPSFIVLPDDITIYLP